MILASVPTLGTLVVVLVVLVVVLSRVFFVVLPMVRVRVRVVRVRVRVVWVRVRVVRVVRMVERRLLQRPSKRATEEIGDFEGLFMDAVPESVTSSARVVLRSSVSPRWTSSVGNWKPCNRVRLVWDGMSKA